MYDLLIRNGTVVDGTGKPPFVADVAVKDGRIVEVRPGIDGDAAETIDATGLLVTPGFVDIHTHYDGQVTWDPLLEPSASHGVTTVIMGNCGVGFAPVRPGTEQWLIQLMEGVEDIPGTALSEGMTWGWESFPEYLDVLERMPRAMDVGTQVPHGAVRAYVMGERGAKNEPATPDDIAAMARIVREAIEAGAFGFSTSRTLAHRAIDGEPVPGTFAAEDELFGIGEALRAVGRGLYELAPAGAAGEDVVAPAKEVDWMCRLSAAIDRPVTFALTQVDAAPTLWRELMDRSLAAVEHGARVYPQIGARPTGVLIGHQAGNVFRGRPSYDELVPLPFEQRVQALRDPARRARILAEEPSFDNPFAAYMGTQLHRIYAL
ncbi:MAG TPA: amidohydrolase family protein, partial [Acidimicrobiales bacterium]